MPKFRFTALDSSGKQLSGSVDASASEAAIEMLQAKGLDVVEITEAATVNKTSPAGATASAPAAKRTTPAPSGRRGPTGPSGGTHAKPAAKKSFAFGVPA